MVGLYAQFLNRKYHGPSGFRCRSIHCQYRRMASLRMRTLLHDVSGVLAGGRSAGGLTAGSRSEVSAAVGVAPAEITYRNDRRSVSREDLPASRRNGSTSKRFLKN